MGTQYVSIYNDAYRPVLGNKHPNALGQPVSECWSEIWHILKPLIDSPFNGGAATWMEDLTLEINRRGFAEETYFTVALVRYRTTPCHGVLAAYWRRCMRSLEKVIGERRIDDFRLTIRRRRHAPSPFFADLTQTTKGSRLRDGSLFLFVPRSSFLALSR